MAGVTITATVSAGEASLSDDFDALLADMGMERYVIHHAGCCDPCRANEDPDDVPCQACRGNIAGRYPGHARAEAVGNLCECTVGIREIGTVGDDA